MKKAIAALVVCCLVAPAMASQTLSYGWEDGVGTILGEYPAGAFGDTNVGAPDPVHSGDRSLRLERLSSGTPQGFVAWIVGLTDGDVIDADFWRYDNTPGLPPSARIWAHYTDTGGTIDDYAGSASGPSDYGPGLGWDNIAHSWTFDSDLGSRDGLVIEARVYSNPGDTVWIDDITVTAPDHATIIFAPEPASLLLVLGGLALVRRRR